MSRREYFQFSGSAAALRKASRTRSNRRAPQEYPATGWKPWPKPRQALVMNMVIRLDTLTAARAEVPKVTAIRLRMMAARVPSPPRKKLALPMEQTSFTSVHRGRNWENLMVSSVRFRQ